MKIKLFVGLAGSITAIVTTSAALAADPFTTPSDLHSAMPEISFRCKPNATYTFTAIDQKNYSIYNETLAGNVSASCHTNNVREISGMPRNTPQGLYTNVWYNFKLQETENGVSTTFERKYHLVPDYDLTSWADKTRYSVQRGTAASRSSALELRADPGVSTLVHANFNAWAYRSATLVSGKLECPSKNCRLGVVFGSAWVPGRAGSRVEATVDYSHVLHVEEVDEGSPSEARRQVIAPVDVSNLAPGKSFTLEADYIPPPHGIIAIYVNGGLAACVGGSFSPNGYQGNGPLEFYASSRADKAIVARYAHTSTRVIAENCPLAPAQPSFGYLPP